MYERCSTGFLRAPCLVYVVLVELAAFKLKIVLIHFQFQEIKLNFDEIKYLFSTHRVSWMFVTRIDLRRRESSRCACFTVVSAFEFDDGCVVNI